MPKFSVIIPVFNAAATLPRCLEAVAAASGGCDAEVLVVDDQSTDGSVSIAREYPCEVLVLEKNMGAGGARNRGAALSRGAILVFVDADIVIPKDTLALIQSDFANCPDLAAVTGCLSAETPDNDFFTSYKNSYMNYVFGRCPPEVDFLYGSIMAVRQTEFLGFNETIKITDDTELGQRYKTLGKKILLDRRLEVIHLKRYNFRTLLKNDFLVPFWWARSFVPHGGFRDILRKKRFAHSHVSQLAGITAAFLTVGSLLFWNIHRLGILPAAFVFMFFLCFAGFFRFILQKRGAWFCCVAVVFTFIDALVMGTGAAAGIVDCLIHPRRERGLGREDTGRS
jgi:glycosyltransferase involved in cell wall biosynthesis